ncbi:unnamed protein product, partial [Discosporangium mesarthrocarpum]
VYLAAIRSFSHKGAGTHRVLQVATRDGRVVQFRCPGEGVSKRCGAWLEATCGQRLGLAEGSGSEELWLRGLWGARTGEMWMERLAEEIKWRKEEGGFVALWHKLCQTATASAGPGEASRGPRGHWSNSGAPRGSLADGMAALERDLERMGVQGHGAVTFFGRQMWEIKPVNRDYGMVHSYPQALAFPSSVSVAELVAAAPQRSRRRLPSLVWLHPVNKAPLVRSSQPMSGITSKVLNEDINLLRHIRGTLDSSQISIVDARTQLNAAANQVL